METMKRTVAVALLFGITASLWAGDVNWKNTSGDCLWRYAVNWQDSVTLAQRLPGSTDKVAKGFYYGRCPECDRAVK